MSSIPFEEVPTTKKVPSSAKVLELLGKNDIVKERYTTSIQPYSGGNAGVGAGLNNKIIWKIFNNTDYVDLTTAYITFQAIFNNTTANALQNVNFEDNVLSWFINARVLVNDILVEEITNFSQWVNLITYATMSKSYYETAGQFQGCYRHSNYIAGGPKSGALVSTIVAGTSPTGAISFPAASGLQNWEGLVASGGCPAWSFVATQGSGGMDTWVNTNVNGTLAQTQNYWSANLGGYLGVFSLQKYFPLRNVSSITLELTLPSNILGIVFSNLLPAANAVPATLSATTLNLNNLYLHYDNVKMSDAYYELMDSELLDANGLGVQFPVDTVECVPASIPQSATQAKKTLVVSKGTRYLKSFYCATSPNFCYQSGCAPPASVFIPAGFVSGSSSAQLVVNSRRYPQLIVDNLPRAFQELQKSTGKYNSVIGDSVITYRKYTQDVAQNAVDLTGNQDLEYSTCIFGFNLEQVIEAGLELQGLDTITSGFQMQLELTTATPCASTIYMFPHFTKVMRIKGGSVAVIN